MEQLLRHELILGLLPNKESALDSNAIHQRVANQGVQVDKRTIQRDLSELEQKFPMCIAGQREKPSCGGQKSRCRD